MSEQDEMSFLQHLEIFRWHLIRSVIAVLIVSIAVFLNKSFVFDTVIFAPKEVDFITFKALCKLSVQLHEFFPGFIDRDAICIGQNMPALQNINMPGQFMTHIMVSIIGGIILAFPYVFWEIWRFIKPALHSGEKNFTKGIVFFTTLLFITGVLFGYYIITPLSVNFFVSYSISSQVINLPTLSTYISTITTIVLACGFVFELPIVVYFLSRVGILSPEILKKYRKHALVGALILSAIITPPDVFSQFLVAIPILLLYEISIIISRIVINRIN